MNEPGLAESLLTSSSVIAVVVVSWMGNFLAYREPAESDAIGRNRIAVGIVCRRCGSSDGIEECAGPDDGFSAAFLLDSLLLHPAFIRSRQHRSMHPVS